MLISPAYAQTAGGGDTFVSLLPLVLIFVVFYFLLIRPQQKKMKAHRKLVADLRRGDRVVTGGGIMGTVSKIVDDNEAIVEIAEGVRVRIVKSTVTDVLARPEAAVQRPAKETKAVGPERQIAQTDYYKVLGVTKNASAKKISAAYQKLAKKIHTDTNPENPEATAQFREISEAYETLRDEQKRALYNKLGHDEYTRITKG
ncbi:MAG: preprotein translocase subunit YajC [Kiloniellaceae bacterium]